MTRERFAGLTQEVVMNQWLFALLIIMNLSNPVLLLALMLRGNRSGRATFIEPTDASTSAVVDVASDFSPAPETEAPEEPHAQITPIARCEAPALRFTRHGRDLLTQRYTVWQLCYDSAPEASAARHSTPRQAHQHTISVWFFDERDRQLRELIQEPIQNQDSAWSVSFVVALPGTQRPLFNIQVMSTDDETSRPESNAPDLAKPLPPGRLRLWRIEPDGQRTASALSSPMLCTHNVKSRTQTFFIPDLACPSGRSSCQLAAYICHDG